MRNLVIIAIGWLFLVTVTLFMPIILVFEYLLYLGNSAYNSNKGP